MQVCVVESESKMDLDAAAEKHLKGETKPGAARNHPYRRLSSNFMSQPCW